MSKIYIELDSEGIQELLKSPEITAVCQEHAKNTVSRCGAGYATDTYVGKTRVNVAVYPDTTDAIRDCLKNNTILKALK